VIRSPRDRGVVVLIDDRYARAEVRRLLPRWWGVPSHEAPARLRRHAAVAQGAAAGAAVGSDGRGAAIGAVGAAGPVGATGAIGAAGPPPP
jgi:hypothetical protein